MLVTESSERTRKEESPGIIATVRRHPRISGYSRERIDGLMAFESGTEAFGFSAPPRRGCRESHTPWSAPRISIRLSPPVALTFYSRVSVHLALPPNHPFNPRTYTVTLRYCVSGWFPLFTTYFRLHKASVETYILQHFNLAVHETYLIPYRAAEQGPRRGKLARRRPPYQRCTRLLQSNWMLFRHHPPRGS